MKKQARYHLLSMPYANASVEFILESNRLVRIRLFSYSTLTLELELNRITAPVTLKICHNVNCSMTTARHVNRFTTELFGENKYHELKKYSVGTCVSFPNLALKAMEMYEWYACWGRVY